MRYAPGRKVSRVGIYTIILSPDPDLGGYCASCPAMPGAITQGDTRAETLNAMRGVMAVWVEVAQEDGYAPLAETPQVIGAKVADVIEDRDESGWDRTIETCMVDLAVPA